MFQKLNYTQKNKLLLPLAGVGIILCWFFAFNKTFEAIKQNNELKGQIVVRIFPSIRYIRRKNWRH
jgi:hypothetical protein